MMNHPSSATATTPKQRQDEILQAISSDLQSKSDQSPHSLANAVRRCINSKCEWSLPTPEFINEIRTKLYVIHKYNCQVLQVKGQYPKTRQLDLLLVRYVELEYEVLYLKCNFSKSREKLVEHRVLRLLWIVLSKALGTTDNVKMKNSVLKLLANVRSDYLGQDKFLGGIAGKLLRGLGKAKYENDIASYLKNSVQTDSDKYLITSDYGSDSDGDSRGFSSWSNSPVAKNDLEEVVNNASNKNDNRFFKNTPCFGKSTNCKSEIKSNDVIICPDSEDDEVQVKNIVTFEIIDDDDDKDGLNYMVYLQKDTVKTNNRKEKCTEPKVCNKANKVEESIIICSDSEDEEKIRPKAAIVDNPVKLEVADASIENLLSNESETHAALDDILKFYNNVEDEEEASSAIKSEVISEDHVDQTEISIKTEEPSNQDASFFKTKTNEDAGARPTVETLSDIGLSTEITVNSDTFFNQFQSESNWLPPFLTDNLHFTNNLTMQPYENEITFDDNNQTLGGPLLSDNSKRAMISSFDALFDDNIPEASGFFDFLSFNNDNDITFGDISRAESDIDGIDQLNNFIQTELGIKSPPVTLNKRISQVSSDYNSSKKSRFECELDPISLSLDKRNAT